MVALGSAVVVGMPPEGEDENSGAEAIALFDLQGQRVGAFGEKYDVKGHWMLNRPLVDEGEVHFIEDKGLYLVAFDNLPYLYFYDLAGSLVTAMEIEEFEQGMYEYDRSLGRLSNPAGAYSQIAELDIAGGEFVVLEVLTFRDRRMVDRQRAWTEERTSYVIEIGSMSSAIVGSSLLEVDFGGSGGGEIFVGDRDLVVNTRGRLVVVK